LVTHTILAIDPGLTGALAFIVLPDTSRVAVYDMPVVNGEVNARELRDLIAKFKPDAAIIEQVGPMPRDGVRQAWRFSSAYTTANVVCFMMGIPTSRVTPATWKKDMKVKGGHAGKEQCRALALRMFPECAASFSRKKDQGRAEAALLAFHAQKKFQLPLPLPTGDHNGRPVNVQA
jgi:Holliday junction resolvasome RuvABC endonuclease subunit